jgi:hypothetical protein
MEAQPERLMEAQPERLMEAQPAPAWASSTSSKLVVIPAVLPSMMLAEQ